MKITTLEISKVEFDKIDESERIFYIIIGHLSNEITTLEKLLFLSITFSDTNKTLGSINASQSLLIARLIAGKVSEGWELLQKAFFASKVSKVVEPDLSVEGRNALAELKRYFGKENLIRKLRNEFSFHYSPENVRKQLPSVKDIEELEICVTEKDEPFFVYSEELITKAILEEIDKSDYEKALDKLFAEIMKITRNFRIFCAESAILMMHKYKISPPHVETDFPSLHYNKKLEVPFLFSDYK
ncbi:MAG TPA: hypothetical protein VF644_13050 [Pyrinomonadaceae bacterium]|jgi:hypothetical protein